MRRGSTAARACPRERDAASERAADGVKQWIRFWSVSWPHPRSRRALHGGDLVLDMAPILEIAAARRCIDSPRVCKGCVNALRWRPKAERAG
ncbi:TPA: hypothetical protein QDE31_04255 [Burkholderia cenocepacia]|nr:hypothetical protein [Burkholderia cenocepacia]